MLWETYNKEAINPLTGEAVVAVRRRLRVEFDLPMKDQYSGFIEEMVRQIA